MLMKRVVPIIVSLSMGLFGCTSQKKLMAKAPFTVSKAVCQTWVGGREESGHGTEVKLSLEGLDQSKVRLQQLYFRGRVGDLSVLTSKEGIMATCSFQESRKDISMHSDPMKEVGNQPPRIKSKEELEFPFELGMNEAVISYTEGDNIKYFKILEVVEKPGRVNQGREKQ